jgi:valyl-tRNA synthetase
MRSLKKFWRNSLEPNLRYTAAATTHGLKNIFFEKSDPSRHYRHVKPALMLGMAVLSPVATTSFVYQQAVEAKQEAVLKNNYWDQAEKTDSATATQDRGAITAQIAAIKTLENKLQNPESLAFSERKATQEELAMRNDLAIKTILYNKSLSERELASYAMSFNFQIDGNKPASPEVFKALREIQYATSQTANEFSDPAYAVGSVESSFNNLVVSYNETIGLGRNPEAALGLFGMFAIIPFIGLRTRNTPKPNKRDFKPKQN